MSIIRFTRFEVVSEGIHLIPCHYWIKDNHAALFRSPERAVPIHFKERQDAQKVCEMLNAEWINFLKNPY